MIEKVNEMDWAWRKTITRSYFSAKRSSVALMSCSQWYIMKQCVCVCMRACAGRWGLLSLHYTRAGSTLVLCPRSLALPAPTWNNELQRMPWGLSGFSSRVDSILAQITSQIAFKWKLLWLFPACSELICSFFFKALCPNLALFLGNICICLKMLISIVVKN